VEKLAAIKSQNSADIIGNEVLGQIFFGERFGRLNANLQRLSNDDFLSEVQGSVERIVTWLGQIPAIQTSRNK
jgi:hypothetical protein